MAVTTPDNIVTPDDGDNYALVQDLGALADSVQEAITEWKSYGIGTDAERLALTGSSNPPLKDGLLWYSTDTDGFYRYDGTTWARVFMSALSPYNSTTVGFTGVPLMKSGIASGTTSGGGVLAHTFPSPFSTACVGVSIMPHQNSGYAAGNLPVLVQASVTATGFSTLWPSAPSVAVALPYIAFGY